MAEQLNLIADGAQPADIELGRTQRAVMRVLRRVGEMSVDEAGAIAHAGRGKHGVDERCGYCGPDGAPILKALADRGLVERVSGGVRLPRAAPVPTADSFPEGF